MTDQAGVEQLLYLMGEAFETLMANVRSVPEADWQWAPRGGRRTVGDIVAHVASCKHMYDHHAFGEGCWTWNEPPFTDDALYGPGRAVGELIDWLREGQRLLLDHVVALDDAELLRPRRTNWGQLRETRWIIAAMINHDVYHAGEINHIRALRQGNDRWHWQSD